MNVCRFGVSLEDDLLEKLDDYVEKHHFPNRSQAIRHLIRNLHVNEIWKENQMAAGSIVLIYDHHKNRLVNSLLSIQHDFSEIILSSQHVHLDHDNCLETIVVRGKPSDIYNLADRLTAIKGIKHGNLAISGF
jgi:CopG family nickel-responsive transcriptional regulator